jgi:hypothetical protein
MAMRTIFFRYNDGMDLRLPLLADANLHLGVAEEALSEGSLQTARREWEKASLALVELEKYCPEEKKEKGLFRAMYLPLQRRSDSIKEQLPKEEIIQEIPAEEKMLLEKDEEEE